MTTYLSRVELNPQRRAGRAVLGSPQAMHAAVLSSFPGRLADRTEARVLWRTDAVAGAVQLYVVSPEQPDFTHLIEQAGWPTLVRWDTRDYGPLLHKLAVGQRWAFRLTANPTRSKAPGDGGRSRRVGHVTAAQQAGWLVDRSAAAGFRAAPAGVEPMEALVVRARDTAQFRRRDGRVTLARATFEGRLEVTDAEALRRTLIAGLGPAKAYGCGLLTLAPV